MANTSSRGKSLKDIRYAVAQQLAKGARPEVIIRQLIERGWPEPTARRFVGSSSRPCEENLTGLSERKAERKRCLRCALRGLLCVILGMALIVVGLWMKDVFYGIFHFTGGVLL